MKNNWSRKKTLDAKLILTNILWFNGQLCNCSKLRLKPDKGYFCEEKQELMPIEKIHMILIVLTDQD